MYGIITLRTNQLLKRRQKLCTIGAGISRLRDCLWKMRSDCQSNSIKMSGKGRTERSSAVGIIEIKDLSFTYSGSEKKTLEHVNLSVEEGELSDGCVKVNMAIRIKIEPIIA